MKKYFTFLTIALLVFNCSYSFAQAQIPLPEEEKTMVGEGIEVLKKTLKEILAVWKEVHQKIMKYWKENILPRIQQWLEKKKPEIREQFEKEKIELKKEIKQTSSNFWEWLKDLVR